MTEQEAKMILAILKQNYKNAKIEDPKAEVAMWLTELGQYPADVVKVAAQFHIARSDFWPTIEAIKKLIPRAEILVQFEKNNMKPPTKQIEAPKRAKVTAIPDGMSEEEFLDSIIQSQIELETEMYGDDDNDDTAGFLPYEK